MFSLPTECTGFQGVKSLAPSYPAAATGMLTGTWVVVVVVAHRLRWSLLLERADLSCLTSFLSLPSPQPLGCESCGVRGKEPYCLSTQCQGVVFIRVEIHSSDALVGYAGPVTSGAVMDLRERGGGLISFL